MTPFRLLQTAGDWYKCIIKMEEANFSERTWRHMQEYFYVHQHRCKNFYLCTVHFEIYVVHTPTNAVFINLVKSFKFTLKYTIMSLLHVSVFNDHHQGALSVLN